MIDINYNRSENKTVLSLAPFTCFQPNELPLKAEFTKTFTGEKVWESDLSENAWVSWSGGETPSNFTVKTADGKLVLSHEFDVIRDGDMIEKTLWYFIKNLDHRPKGLVIGCHDGSFGHWCFPVMAGLTDVTFVDGSKPQLDKCIATYEHLKETQYVNFIHDIITTDGADVDWYVGGEGFTDTIFKPVINIFLPDEKIEVSHRTSTSINDLIEREFGDKPLDWLHLDLEGIDGDIILALKYEPTLVIFELMHLSQNKRFELLDWFQERNYRFFTDGSNAIAMKQVSE